MEIKINEKINEKLEKDKINICIEYSNKTEIDNFIEYINKYDWKEKGSTCINEENKRKY